MSNAAYKSVTSGVKIWKPTAAGSISDECLRAMANPFQFLQEVRSEANKVTWPTRRETLITTVLVIVMVLCASFFFLAVDQSLRLMIKLILSLGHSS